MADDTDDTNFFSNRKYGRDKGVGQDVLVDTSDTYANYGQYMISFQHLGSGRTVYFKAFVTEYAESYSATWTPTTVYGRTDPIQTYSGTTRTISLAFDVPASSVGESYENLGRVSKLVQMLYPSYAVNEQGTGRIIGQAPLVRVKMMNLITNERYDFPEGLVEPTDKARRILEEYQTSPIPENGVLSAISSISYRSDLSQTTMFEKAANTILPQNVSVSMNFAVIHENTIGWDSSTGDPLDESFPHKIRLSKANGLRQVSSDQRPSDVTIRIGQEETNTARHDANEAIQNRFLENLTRRAFTKSLSNIGSTSAKDVSISPQSPYGDE